MELSVVSSLEFSTQIDQGLLNSSQLNEKVNGFYNINYSSTGEKITINPVSVENLDDSVSGQMEKNLSLEYLHMA